MEEQRARELVDRYADAIIRLGYTWLGDLDDAKDICQEVLLKLLADGRTFPDRGQERAWVVRVAVNQCKNWKKSAWFRRRAPLEEGLHLSVEAPEPEDGALLEQVSRLPPQIPAGALPAVLRGLRGTRDRRPAGPEPCPGEYPPGTGQGKAAAAAGRELL